MKWNVRVVVSSTLGFLLLIGALAAIALVAGAINASRQPAPSASPVAEAVDTASPTATLPAISKPSPVSSPTPMSLQPTPVLTLTAVAPQATPVVSSLKVVWADRLCLSCPSLDASVKFWVAGVTDPANRTLIAELPKGVRLFGASLSPDGSRVAYTTVGPTAGSRPWKHGELWVMNIDGSGQKQLATGMIPHSTLYTIYNYPAWPPNGKTLVYARLIPKSPTPVNLKEVSPYNEEIVLVAVDTGEERSLIVTDEEESPVLLGWSQDGQHFFFFSRFKDKVRGLWAVNVATGELELRAPLLDPLLWLSPDGRAVVFGSADGLTYLSTDGKERRVIAQVPRADDLIWSSDSRKVIIGTGFRFQEYDVATSEMREIIGEVVPTGTESAITCDPISLSPDGQWLVCYARGVGDLYLLGPGTQVRFPAEAPIGGPYFVGWLP